jgi:hypothetical protein
MQIRKRWPRERERERERERSRHREKKKEAFAAGEEEEYEESRCARPCNDHFTNQIISRILI